jgi:dienelactone hydrolase
VPERRALISMSIGVVLLLAGCGSGNAHSASAPRVGSSRCAGTGTGIARPSAARETTPGVTRIDLDLIDRSRSTPAIPARPGFPCRMLPTEIRYPTGATDALPLVIVAHGLDGNPSSLGPLLDAWAAAGYVVTAPTFPTTDKDSSGTSLPSNNVGQAADISFVIDQLLDQGRANATDPAHGLIDARHIGVAGMSLGGQTVYGLIANSCCEDDRVSAAIVLAGVHRDYPGGKAVRNRVPVLLEQGDADQGYHNSVEAYPKLAPPKWFITLHGVRHAPAFEIPLGPAAPLARATTTDFWNLYLKGDAAASARIVGAVDASHGAATLRRDLG